MTREEMMLTLGQMSVMEMVELVKTLEEEWGVSASDALAVRMVEPVGLTSIPEPPPAYDVVLVAHGPQKVRAIQLVRGITGLGLREALMAVTEGPTVLKEQLEPEVARDLIERFREIGAHAELR